MYVRAVFIEDLALSQASVRLLMLFIELCLKRLNVSVGPQWLDCVR